MPGPAPSPEPHLELIAEMSQEFADSRDADAVLAHALVRITDHIGAEGGTLFLVEDDSGDLVCRASAGAIDLVGLRLAAGQGIVGNVVQGNACALVRDVLEDPNFESRVDEDTGFTTRSILCASLSVRDHSLGAIELVNMRGGGGLFDEDDRRLLRTLAAAAGLALQNARLAAERVEQERVARELELAREIQSNLLPGDTAGAVTIAGINLPAREVSGDFFDHLVRDDGHVAFCIGDVAGKGMNAALLMAKTSSLFRCLAKSARDPAALLAAINREVCETATRGIFVTVVVGEIDPETHRVRLANAGHEPPLVRRRDGRWESLPAEAPPLGILDDAAFPEQELDLVDGALYLVTDGVTEARWGDGRLGVEGLQSLIAKEEGRPPAERLQAVAERIADDPLHDDLTLLVVDPCASRS